MSGAIRKWISVEILGEIPGLACNPELPADIDLSTASFSFFLPSPTACG